MSVVRAWCETLSLQMEASLLRRVDRRQQRSRWLAIPFAVLKKFYEDGATRLGVQIAYWAFFSVFALLLAFAAILGFLLESDPGLQRELLNSTLERMPVLGPQIRGEIGTLTGSGLALAIGLAGALWTGLGITLALGDALDRIWAVAPVDGPGFVRSRARGLLVLTVIGSANVMATAGVGIVTSGGAGGAAIDVAGLLASAAVDLVLFAASFRLLTAAPVTTAHVLPGAIFATCCWLALQALGGVFVTQVLAGSSQIYGGFAAVVGLLSWLLIAAELVLLAAELNVVLVRGLWPRSLTGPLLTADRRALTDAARAARRDRRQRIAVRFDDEA